MFDCSLASSAAPRGASAQPPTRLKLRHGVRSHGAIVKISTVLDKIDSGAIALPEFQRGYVWSRRQVRDLVESLYRRFPVGSLLLWETATESAHARGEGKLQRGYVSLLLDGQQRISSLYGLIRGRPPKFFDGDARAFTDLRFNVETEQFQFYAPVTMREDPLWLDVSELMRRGPGWAMGQIQAPPERFTDYLDRVNRLHAVRDIELHDATVTGEDKSIDVVVDLFNRVNTGGTKLSKGDLALAKLCASWPPARNELKTRLAKWERAGFHFSLDWLLRNVNAVVNGRAELAELGDIGADKFIEGIQDTERAVDTILNLISSRLGLDHDRVLGGVGAIPVMSRFVADRDFRLPDAQTSDRLLYWYVHSFLWGRYAGSTETVLNTDLQLVDPTLRGLHARSEQVEGDALDHLIAELRGQRGSLRVSPADLRGWSRGARFYPLLYMLSRVGGAHDLGSGLELRGHLLGKHASLEIHHVFPKALLYRHGYGRPERNALANFAFLTLDSNRSLGERPPHEYLPEYEARHPGVLASQWIPDDPELWHLDRYLDFLARRRELLAQAANDLLDGLLGGQETTSQEAGILDREPVTVGGGDEEDQVTADVQGWMADRGLQRGIEDFAILALDGRSEEAVLDIAWPDGLTHGEEKVALLLNEPPEVVEAAGRHGYRFFTSVGELQTYAQQYLAEAAA